MLTLSVADSLEVVFAMVQGCRVRAADFCWTMRQINTSASSTVRSAKSDARSPDLLIIRV
jgi:hypothetical protein